MAGPAVTAPAEFVRPPPVAAAGAGAATRESGPATAAASGTLGLVGDEGFTFRDLLDIINPLQHIPIVSAIYRRLTGDTIHDAPRLIGGTLFGGAIGAAFALVNVLVERATGRDVSETVLAFLDGATGQAPTAVAAAAPANGASEDPSAPTADPSGPEEALVAVAARDEPPGTPLDLRPPAAPRPPSASAARSAALPAPATRRAPAPPPIETAAASARRRVVAARDERAGVERALARDTARSAAVERTLAPAPAGATAAEGGWFTDAMLSALAKYRETLRLVRG